MVRNTGICEQCQSEFVRKDPRGRFCNRSCSASWSGSRYPKRTKSVKPVSKSKVQQWLDGEFDGTTKAGLAECIRQYLLKLHDYKCEQCDWSGFNSSSGKSTLTVDHIDGNSQNNQANNLKVLCPNCHSLTPTYGALNKGNGRKSRYEIVAQLASA